MAAADKAKTSTTDTNTQAKGRFWRGFGRTFFWFLGISLAWWFISFIIPGLPTPLQAGKGFLGVVKSVSDDIYNSTRHDDLERAAKKVYDAAEESGPGHDTMMNDTKRLTADRRAKLPAVDPQEDSALRAELGSISHAPAVRGRLINVLLIGIDSRLGVRDARSDAVHLFTINPDSAIVEIMSIPRGTYVDLGYPDTTTFNIIANARGLGMDGLMRRVAELTNRGPIKYYAEVGFSQALGVLEILGYKDPVSTLRFLRTRKAHGTGDIQRSHNQGIFLRQNLISKFGLFTGATGDLLLTAGLQFVTTNMTKEFCQGLVYALQQKNFPMNRPDAVRLRMLPMYNLRLKEMTADSATVARTLAKADRSVSEEDNHIPDVTAYLWRQIGIARQDSTRPRNVVTRLSRLHEQHAWVQIQDKSSRRAVRDSLSMCLERAYRRMGKTADAERIVQVRKSEDVLLSNGKR